MRAYARRHCEEQLSEMIREWADEVANRIRELEQEIAGMKNKPQWKAWVKDRQTTLANELNAANMQAIQGHEDASVLADSKLVRRSGNAVSSSSTDTDLCLR